MQSDEDFFLRVSLILDCFSSPPFMLFYHFFHLLSHCMVFSGRDQLGALQSC